MKKLISKNTFFAFIIGGILFGSIGVLATNYLYKSKDVLYASDKTDKTNVSEALDELFEIYNNKNNYQLITLITNFKGSQTVDIKSLYPTEYTKFTNDNFIIKHSSTNVRIDSGRDPAENKTATASGGNTINYDSTTGIVSVNVPTVTAKIFGNTDLPATATIYADLLLVK